MILREELACIDELSASSGVSGFHFLCQLFDKALSNLGKMPRLWIMYIEFLIERRQISRTRQVVNAALRALPITQHDRIWDLVINRFIGSQELMVPTRTCKRLLERYLQYEPEYADSVVSLLIEKGDIASAVELLIKRIEDAKDESSSRLLLLIELIAKNSNKLKALEHYDLPAIIRAGLEKYPSKLGELWNALSDYYIRLGLFSKAIDVYEEAMESVHTVIDFSVIFESYQNFLELIVQTKVGAGSDPDSAEIDLQRLELLIDRRADLLSSVVLRQNPHNVIEWIKRAKLPRIIQGGPAGVVSTYLKGIETVNPNDAKVVGRISSLWIELARHYIVSANDFDAARGVFEKAVLSSFKSVEDLASVWIEFVLMELRLATSQDCGWERVLETARRAISQYRGSPRGTVQSSLYRSVKLWNLALDIEESLNGDAKPGLVRGIYDSMMELKVVTPQAILNYAQFELDRKCFEKSIQVLEKGISLFPWPHCRDIWLFYVSLVQKEKKRFSTERIRDLFDQVVSNCGAKFASIFYFCAFKFELERGTATDAISLLSKGASSLNVPTDAKTGFFLMAISQSMKVNGAAATRYLFEQAISTLIKGNAVRQTIEMCIEYCWMEAKLGQINRARKLLEHASQFANPGKPDFEFFWDVWKNFEIEHGSEDSYKEMKRVRRAVEIKFSDKHFNTLDVGLVGSSDVVMQEEGASENGPVSSPPAGIDVTKLKQMAAALRKRGRSEDNAESSNL